MTIANRLKQLLRRAVPPVPAATPTAPEPPPERWEDQFASPSEAAAWVTARLESGRLYADLDDSTIEQLRQRFPGLVARTVDSAERVIRHEFDLLGSGRRVIADPD